MVQLNCRSPGARSLKRAQANPLLSFKKGRQLVSLFFIVVVMSSIVNRESKIISPRLAGQRLARALHSFILLFYYSCILRTIHLTSFSILPAAISPTRPQVIDYLKRVSVHDISIRSVSSDRFIESRTSMNGLPKNRCMHVRLCRE
jgi:hypothetical protein